MKEHLQAADEEDEDGKGGGGGEKAKLEYDEKTGKMVVTPEEKARLERIKREKQEEADKERKERVDLLVGKLKKKLDVFTESLATGGDEKEVSQSFKVRRSL
jgi:IMP dehydrogenase/GMP reductase